MDISSIIYAALGGAIGGVISSLIVRQIKKNNDNKALTTFISVAFIMCGYLASTTLYKNMVFPRIVPLDAKEINESIPFLTYIREEDPKTYSELMAPLDKMIRNNDITAKSVTEFRDRLTKVMNLKKRTASAETLRSENATSIELYTILTKNSPRTCTQKFYGRPYDRLDIILNDEYTMNEQQSLSKYFTEPPRPTTYVVDLKQGKSIVDAMMLRLVKKNEITDIDPPILAGDANRDDHEKICSLHIDFNREINELSDADLLHVFSYLQSSDE